uniref:Protein farnesyltransferase subunit beta n=1 Tax=Riptortus pedestris TaxID=329032 RepID=R4WT47_RIPPE|nr:protein farnesyltransferase beta subunit [Riptortus pedestris]
MTTIECSSSIPNESTVVELLLGRAKFDDEGVATVSSDQQVAVESSIEEVYSSFDKTRELVVNPDFPELQKHWTKDYLINNLLTDKLQYEVYDCNRGWLCYWIIHSLSLLDYELDDVSKSCVVKFLSSLQNEDGGFGGGPNQFSHLAPTYAAVNALCIIGTEDAFKAINRKTLLEFLRRLRVGDGSFYMHNGGEIDMRSVYCAISVAKLTNVFSDELFKGSAEWIVRCQTYEGGFSGTPGMEAHGGYTFCGFAALHLLNSHNMCDVKALLRWLTNRQMSFEGGFQGRTNKLVDSCYSFWQAGAIALINLRLLSDELSKKYLNTDTWLFNCNLLQEYVLICCQHKNGGLIDKPGKRRDAYHTCYSLSGLSLAQNLPNGNDYSIGSDENILEPVHPAYNITAKKLIEAMKYFCSLEQ